MAITGPLIAANAGNPKVRSERSVEYQDLGLLQDSRGGPGACARFLQGVPASAPGNSSNQSRLPDHRAKLRDVDVAGGQSAVPPRGRSRSDSHLARGDRIFRVVPRKTTWARPRARRSATDARGHPVEQSRSAWSRARLCTGPGSGARWQRRTRRTHCCGSTWPQAISAGQGARDRASICEAIPLLSRSARIFETAISRGRVRDETPNGPARSTSGLAMPSQDGAICNKRWRATASRPGVGLVGSKSLDASLLCELGAGLVRVRETLSRLRKDGRSADGISQGDRDPGSCRRPADIATFRPCT